MLTFAVTDATSLAPKMKPPYVVLQRENWDDFRFKTTFRAILYTDDHSRHELGTVKILRRDQQKGPTPINKRFDKLDENYCSVGQSSDYYQIVSALPSSISDSYLRSIRDAAYDASIRSDFENESGWSVSLLRFGHAENALAVAAELNSGAKRPIGIASFKFHWISYNEAASIEFLFDDSGPTPGRCNVLVGYNGAGKTTLLADIALTISRVTDLKPGELQSSLTGVDTTFGAVVAVSYSAFDTFEIPSSISNDGPEKISSFGYTYCGLRRVVDTSNKVRRNTGRSPKKDLQLKSIHEIELEFGAALNDAHAGENHGHLGDAFEILSAEPSFGRIGVDIRQLSQLSETVSAIEQFSKLSTGHKIVVNIITQLAAHLQNRSLLLVDEPETHLHPPLAAALLRAIQYLLDKHDSFAIIATHSPVVVQEIPARFVQILERIDNQTTTITPDIETFGESIGAITRFVFSMDSSSTDYQSVLAHLAITYSMEEIEEMFQPSLSAQARALVLNYMHQK